MEKTAQITKLSEILENLPTDSPEHNLIRKQLEQLQQNYHPSFFQALGCLKGVLSVETEKKLSEEGDIKTLKHCYLTTHGKRYKINADPKKYNYLLSQAKKEEEVWIMAYPRLVFIPKQRPELRFTAVLWRKELIENFAPDEFILRGIWQFIPQVRTPVISVLRNYLEKEKRDAQLAEGKDFKGIHVPLLWKSSPVLPYRHNPKSDEQMPRHFVEIKAKFIPKLDSFGFTELLGEPSILLPKHLVSKRKMEEKRKKWEGNNE
jgi:hypothetical protein